MSEEIEYASEVTVVTCLPRSSLKAHNSKNTMFEEETTEETTVAPEVAVEETKAEETPVV